MTKKKLLDPLQLMLEIMYWKMVEVGDVRVTPPVRVVSGG
jgi:hypothetical protein